MTRESRLDIPNLHERFQETDIRRIDIWRVGTFLSLCADGFTVCALFGGTVESDRTAW